MSPTMGVVAGSFRRGGGGAGGGPSSDITALITDLGGDSAVLAFYDVRHGVTTSGSNVTGWADARGASGYGPAFGQAPTGNGTGYPTWDAVNLLIQGSGTQALVTAASALFDLSPAKSLIIVSSFEPNAIVNPDYIAALSTDGSRLLGIGSDSGIFSSNIMALALGTDHKYGSTGVAPSTSRRLIIATKGAAANTLTAQIPSNAANVATSSTGGAIPSGNNAACLFGYGGNGSDVGSWGKGSCRAYIVLDHAATSGEVSDLATWATTYHGVTLA